MNPSDDNTANTDSTDSTEGRFFLITGPGADDVARALSAALPRAASVDGAVVAAMFSSSDAGASGRDEMERRFLRYTAGIALADSFRLAGYDAVVAEDVPLEHLEAYLDFASPTPVHLVRLGDEFDTDAVGLGVSDDDAEAIAAQIVRRADEAVVEAPDERSGDADGTVTRPDAP
ncbi:hypothetical protein [Mobilicoccus massiliensis]|uniref:hypothetical protein n=1 Tax=Mobilicoccus massiliensis TaxID=1522310 RepID=UPI001C3EA5F0|nr:hypothetical protein [Mobilicoccus massiliensis]